MKNIIEFSHPEDPLPFADSFGDDLDAEVFLIIVFCQCMRIILLLFPLNKKSLSLVD